MRIAALAPVVLFAAVLLAGCGGDEPDPQRYHWVLVDADSLTGFYLGRTTGGLVTIRVEDLAYEELPSPATPPLPPPIEVYGTLFPDDAGAALPLTGYMFRSSGTTHFEMYSSDYGYRFAGTYSNQGWSFGGLYTSPSDTGYFGGYVGSIDSVQVYCGSFAGDSLGGHWHFAVRAPALRGAAFASDTSVVFAFDGTLSDPSLPASLTFAGTGGDLSLNGSGALDLDTGSGVWALGAFDSGTWAADRMRADSTTASIEEVVDK